MFPMYLLSISLLLFPRDDKVDPRRQQLCTAPEAVGDTLPASRQHYTQTSFVYFDNETITCKIPLSCILTANYKVM